ncbi:MAG: hypothetical protein FWF95_03825 [Syntrophorhabdaceae bacterium]|nr:hypothetical protein [Syntrophorhabdaceae bacterium]
MQPPKERYLKHIRMDAETPVLVLKHADYVVPWWVMFLGSILYAFIWAGFLILFVLVVLMLILSCSVCAKHYIITFCLFAVFVCISIYMFVYEIERLNVMLKSLKLYSDRVKMRGIFWNKTIYLDDAKISININRKTKFFGKEIKNTSACLYVTSEGGSFYGGRITIKYDLNWREINKELDNIINSCRSIGIEFEKSSDAFGEKYEQI